jgi:hypothetical protein
MKVLESVLIDSINRFLAFVQDKLQFLAENSFIVKNLDNIIFGVICFSLVTSLFLPTELIGISACLVIALVVLKLLLHKGQNLSLISCNLVLLIFLIISFISVVNSTLFHQSLYGFSKTLIYFGFYFSVIQYLRFNKNKIIPLLSFIALLCSIESFYGIFQNTLGLSNISTWQDTSYVNPEDVLSRVYGTLQPYNPNLFAAYLMFLSALLLLQYFLPLKKRT